MPAILLLGKYAVKCLKDYRKQLKEGNNPEFTCKVIPEIENETKECRPERREK